jgi:hypothetical protein
MNGMYQEEDHVRVVNSFYPKKRQRNKSPTTLNKKGVSFGTGDAKNRFVSSCYPIFHHVCCD